MPSPRARGPNPSRALLVALRRAKDLYGGDAGAAKARLLHRLRRARLRSAAEVLELHEIALFLRSYPDDAAVLEAAETLLGSFHRRADLKAHRDALEDSGIRGTDTRYAFFQPTASRLAGRYPDALEIVWEDFEHGDRLLDRLPLLACYGETPALDQADLGTREWVDRMRGTATDATFVIRRFDALEVPPRVREQLFDELELPLRLRGSEATPSRTNARAFGPPVVFQTAPLRRSRPVLAEDLLVPPRSIDPVTGRAADELVELARNAMVVRSRDLDAFAYASPDDVRLVDAGDGLAFAVMGMIPERRLLLESVYAFVTLKNGVPIGYVLVSALFGSSEIAYNVFDTWRGAEAAWIYGRVLATTRALFGSDTFTVYPYQLGGEGNQEGLESGAWWFYQKLGFRARAPETLRLMERELARLRRRPDYRTPIETLATLAEENVYLETGARRDDVIGIFPLDRVGLAVTDFLAKRSGVDRRRAEADAAIEVARLLGVADLDSWTEDERRAFHRFAPLVLALGDVPRWSGSERQDLARAVKAKGGVRESDWVTAIDAHARFRASLRRLVARSP